MKVTTIHGNTMARWGSHTGMLSSLVRLSRGRIFFFFIIAKWHSNNALAWQLVFAFEIRLTLTISSFGGFMVM